MSKLKTFLELVENLPSETVSYLDDEIVNQFLAPLEIYNSNPNGELLLRFTTKEAFSDTNCMRKYGDLVNVYLFDNKPFALVHQTGKWLGTYTTHILDPVVLGEVQHAIIEQYSKNNPAPSIIDDTFFDRESKWVKSLTNPEIFPFKYNNTD